MRVQQQAAFILHQRPFRDSSQLLDVLSEDHGRLALVARGSRSARSRLRGILRPFQPLRMSWVQKRDLGTLTAAELEDRPLTLTGDSLLSAYYLNELLICLLHRHDPQPEVFAAYRAAIHGLLAVDNPAPVLRHFELQLLQLLGYALEFDGDARTGAAIAGEAHYEYRPDEGAVRVDRPTGDVVFAGAELIGIRDEAFDDPAILRAAARLLRRVIDYHLDGRELQTRKVLVDLRRIG